MPVGTWDSSTWDGGDIWGGGSIPSYEICADWDRDAFFCAAARPGDALNLIPTPLTWGTIGVSASFGGSATKTDTVTDYGHKVLRVVTDADTNDGGYFGRTSGGVIGDIAVTAGSTYTMSAWVRGITNYLNVTMEFQVRNQANTNQGTFDSFDLTTDWVRYDKTFTASVGSTHVFLDTHKFNETALVTYEITGVMMVAGSTAPQGFNVGTASNLLDNITAYVMIAKWKHGMDAAYMEVADAAECTLTVSNVGGHWNPEDTNSTFYGLVKRGTILRVRVTHALTTYQLWIGKIQDLNPMAGVVLERKAAILHAEDQTAALQRAEYEATLLEDATMDEGLTDVFEQDVAAWPYAAAPDAVADYTDFDEGITQVSYLGDNLGSAQSVKALQAIRDYTAGDAGAMTFWDGRETKWKFFNRHHHILEDTVVATFDESELVLPLPYTTAEVTNRVTVRYQRRKVGNAAQVLWEYPSLPLNLQPGDLELVIAHYTDVDQPKARVGGKDIITPVASTDYLAFENSDASGTNYTSQLDVTLVRARADRARIRITNNAPKEVYVTTMQLRGTPIYAYTPQEATSEDTTSEDTYDVNELSMSVLAIDKHGFAKSYADWLVDKWSTPAPRIKEISIQFNAEDVAGVTKALARSIGDRITLTNGELAHDRDYLIVGERHSVQANIGKDSAGVLTPSTHRVTFVLRPVDRVQYWILSNGTNWTAESTLGTTTRLAL